MDELIKEIKKSTFNKDFYSLIDKQEIIYIIKKCNNLDHASIFINNIIDLEDTLKNKSFQELLNSNYSYDGLNEPLFKELLDCRLFIKEVLTNEEYNYTQPLTKEFYERLYIRIILLKEGWKSSTIETFLKTNYTLNWDIIRYKFTYIYLKAILNIPDKQQPKGRPKLPPLLKEYIQPKLQEKNKKRMKSKYDISKDLNNLFTKDDINIMLNKLKDNSLLIQKINILSKYTFKNSTYRTKVSI